MSRRLFTAAAATGLTLLTGCSNEIVNGTPTHDDVRQSSTAHQSAVEHYVAGAAGALVYEDRTEERAALFALDLATRTRVKLRDLDGGIVLAGKPQVSGTGRRLVWRSFAEDRGTWTTMTSALPLLAPVELGADFEAFALSKDGARLVSVAWRDGARVLVDVSTTDGTERVVPIALAADAEPEHVALSPDGRQVALVVRGADAAVSLQVADLETGTLTLLRASAEELADVVWSNDGARIAFTEHRGTTGWDLTVVSVASGAVVRLALVEGGLSPRRIAWSPDDATLGYADYDEALGTAVIRTIASGGGTPTLVAHLDAGLSAGGPIWSPDGGRLVYVAFDEVDARGVLRSVVRDGSDEETLVGLGTGVGGTFAVWLPGLPPVAQ